MYLVSLIYASRAHEGFGPKDIEQVLNTSRTANVPRGVTGMLCFDGYNFLQVLEGSRDKVNALYRHIMKDPRHYDVTLLDYQDITARAFDNWYMGYFGLNADNKQILLKYCTTMEFDPFNMSGSSARALLSEFEGNLG